MYKQFLYGVQFTLSVSRTTGVNNIIFSYPMKNGFDRNKEDKHTKMAT